MMPPAVPRLLLRLLLQADTADAVIGDLNEAHAADRVTRGALAARWRYWRDALSWDTLRLALETRRTPSARAPYARSASYAFSPSAPFRELRFAARTLARQPVFSLTVVLLLAVGIGATTTIFSVVDGVLLRSLPYKAPAELARLDQAGMGSVPVPDYRDWVAASTAFRALAGSSQERFTLTADGEPVRLQGASVTANFFATLGVTAYRGRLLVDEDFDGSRSAAVVSYGIWRRRWGGDPSVIGRTLTLDDRPVTVVGVLPPDFVPVDALWQTGAEIWIPFDLDDPRWGRRTWVLTVLGRLAPGVTLEGARAEMAGLAVRLAEAHPETNRMADGSAAPITVTGLREATVGDVSTAILMLFGAVGLLLLLMVANVANLFLARGAERRRELAVRSALGARRGRLIRQLVTEGLLLAGAGGAAGLVLATYGVGALRWLDPGKVPRLDAVTVDWRVMAFTVAVSLVTGVVFAAFPAVNATRVDLATALKVGARGGTAGRSLLRITNVVVSGEIAVALMLLVGAGLLLNSFVRLRNIDPGFDARGVRTVDVRLGTGYDDRGAKVAFTDALLERIGSLPGVVRVGASHRTPMGGGVSWVPRVRDAAESMDEGVQVRVRTVTPGYLGALGVPIRRGRGFSQADGADAPPVAIVSSSLAAALWPGEDPLGKVIVDAQDEEDLGRLTVVGEVGEVKYSSLTDPGINLFVPFAQGAWYSSVSVAIATRDGEDAGALQAGVKEAVWALDPAIPVPPLERVTDRIAATTVTSRFYSTLLASFGGIALLLAAGGIYGTMLYAVGRRRKEFGIRLAVGSTPEAILRLILSRGLVLTGIGLALGLTAAVVLSRVLETLVFGITTTDLPTYVGVVAVLLLASLAACYLPGRRAAATDPVATLNAE